MADAIITHMALPKQKVRKNRLGLPVHAHTGMRLHRRHTSYWAVVLFLVGGALLIMTMQRTGADSYDVKAKVPAPLPTVAATITDPADGAAFKKAPQITVAGTCQILDPAVIVALWRGMQLLGAGVCDSNGTFSIPVTLVPGLNQITPRTVNITDDYGPDGVPVTYTFTEEPVPVHKGGSVPPASTGSNGQPITAVPQALTPDLVLTANAPFIVYVPGQPVDLPLHIAGGSAPYATTIAWGDGKQASQAVGAAGIFVLQHTYAGQIMYQIDAKAVDSESRSSHLQLVALTLTHSVVAQTQQSGGGGPPYLWLWAAYGVVIVAVIGFWAGELYFSTLLPHALPAAHKLMRVRHRRRT
jgi:hypothetical protein